MSRLLSTTDRHAVRKLVNLLEGTPPMSARKLRKLQQKFFEINCKKWEAAGTPFGSNGGPDFITFYLLAPHVDESESDPRILIDTLQRGWAHYLQSGSGACCFAAKNLCEFLSSRSEQRLESEFLNAYNKHFGNRVGRVDAWLVERMIELNADRNPLCDLRLARLRSRVDHLVVGIKEVKPIPGSRTEFHVEFDMMCSICGGWMLRKTDVGGDDPVCRCTACDAHYGKFSDIKALCEHVGKLELKRRKLGAFAETP